VIGPDRHRRHRMPLGGALICRGIWRSVGTERLAARFNSHGKLNLMPPNVKNQTNAKISNGDAFGSSIRPAIRKPSKPATPNTVTTSSAVEAVHILDLRPIPGPIRSTKGWWRRHRKTSRRGQSKYKRVIKPEGAFHGGSRRAAAVRLSGVSEGHAGRRQYLEFVDAQILRRRPGEDPQAPDGEPS
jgi:hypothetical protein